MKKLTAILAAGAATVALVACGGVDREGTRDNLVEQVEAMGGSVDEDCVDGVLDEYSDDDLESFDDQLSEESPSEEAQAFLSELMTCVSIGS